MKFLTKKEIAGMFNVNPYSVQRWIENGQLKAVKINGRLYIDPREFDRFLKANTTR